MVSYWPFEEKTFQCLVLAEQLTSTMLYLKIHFTLYYVCYIFFTVSTSIWLYIYNYLPPGKCQCARASDYFITRKSYFLMHGPTVSNEIQHYQELSICNKVNEPWVVIILTNHMCLIDWINSHYCAPFSVRDSRYSLGEWSTKILLMSLVETPSACLASLKQGR